MDGDEVTIEIEALTPPDPYPQACAWLRAVLAARTVDSRLWALSMLLKTLGIDPHGPLAMPRTLALGEDPGQAHDRA